MKFRITQSALWRQDIRSVVGLVERKMKAYLLVSVLMLGFAVALWCEGKMPDDVPSWMLLGNQVAICGAFMFFLLTVWLATHAAVAAQSYETRILTQLVRLPVPSWEEVEASRTYASDFERLEAKQMFRLPFLFGRQERLPRDPEMSERPEREGVTSADPWGLERRADNTYDLGCGYGSEVAKLRHIKLIRHAATYWQTYDAFARISMNMGVNQLMLAVSYYVLGYVVVFVKSPFAAFAVVLVLVMMCEVVANLDMALTKNQFRLIHVTIIVGPAAACVASYETAVEIGSLIAGLMVPIAFLAHAGFLWLMARFCEIQEQDGAMLPVAFRYVLYLDVFAWFNGKSVDEDEVAAEEVATVAVVPADDDEIEGVAEQSGVPPPCDPRETAPNSMRAHLSHFAADYLDPDFEARESDNEEPTKIERRQQPGLQTIGGSPTRPKDLRPPGVDDMRHMPGAPRMWETVNADTAASKDFYNSVSFMEKGLCEPEMSAIVTGHDRERPGILPWTVFRHATLILALVWTVSAVYCLVDILWFGPDPDGDIESSLLLTEKIDVSWPPGVSLKSFSCDAKGQFFTMTDGISIFGAQLTEAAPTGIRGTTKRRSLSFTNTSVCTALLGHTVKDVAVVCDEGCQAVVLHGKDRLGTCSLGGTGLHLGRISLSWLDVGEHLSGIVVDPTCSVVDTSLTGCTSVTTNRGRVAQLRQGLTSILPIDILQSQGAQAKGVLAVRPINHRYLGVLSERMELLDTTSGVVSVLQRHPVAGFCVGDGIMFTLTGGRHPEVHSSPVPQELL